MTGVLTEQNLWDLSLGQFERSSFCTFCGVHVHENRTECFRCDGVGDAVLRAKPGVLTPVLYDPFYSAVNGVGGRLYREVVQKQAWAFYHVVGPRMPDGWKIALLFREGGPTFCIAQDIDVTLLDPGLNEKAFVNKNRPVPFGPLLAEPANVDTEQQVADEWVQGIEDDLFVDQCLPC